MVDPAPALPLPPVHLRARRRGNGDIALHWVWRNRADGDGWGIAEPPLEHMPEGYQVSIVDGATARRVIQTAQPSAVYGSAEQIDDFGGLPASFSFHIAQLSPVLGPGHPATGASNG
ncbi:MAG: hypothetical protein MO852_13250 [Candidatus Devosia euplotis]|nr:hypothetical protein [Candidatus Devosia euplotis]